LGHLLKAKAKASSPSMLVTTKSRPDYSAIAEKEIIERHVVSPDGASADRTGSSTV